MERIEYYSIGDNLKVALVSLPINTVSVGITVPVGAIHESRDQYGIAHLLEHMIFGGTTTMNDDQIDRYFENLGAVINAFTNYNETVYYSHGSGRHAIKLLEGIMNIYLNSVFPADKLEQEKQVVKEELKMRSEDRPGKKSYDASIEVLFEGINERMRHDVGGYVTDIDKYTRQDLLDFRNKHYKEAYLVVSGSFDRKKIVDSLQNMLKDKIKKWKPTFEKKEKKLIIPHYGTLGKNIHIDSNINQTQVSFYFRSVSSMSKWTQHMSVISYILTGNLNSMLNSVLRKKMGATYGTESYQVTYKDNGCFVITFSCNHDRVKESIDVTLNVLEQLKRGDIDHEYLKIVKNKKETLNMFAFENMSNYFDFAIDALLMKLPFPDPKKIMKRYTSITIDELQQLAQKVFVKSNMLLITEGRML